MSKKNRVYLARRQGRPCVLKVYRAEFRDREGRESAVLTCSRSGGVPVPMVLDRLPRRALLLEYVPGDNLCDRLNEDPDPAWARALAVWLAAFHACLARTEGRGVIRGDAILRNFICVAAAPTAGLGVGAGNMAVCGLDFEESRGGDPSEDLGEVCASILDTDPMFTPSKVRLCRELLSAYERRAGSLDHGRVLDHLGSSLRAHARHRPGGRDYLCLQADRIAAAGLDGCLSPDGASSGGGQGQEPAAGQLKGEGAEDDARRL